MANLRRAIASISSLTSTPMMVPAPPVIASISPASNPVPTATSTEFMPGRRPPQRRQARR